MRRGTIRSHGQPALAGPLGESLQPRQWLPLMSRPLSPNGRLHHPGTASCRGMQHAVPAPARWRPPPWRSPLAQHLEQAQEAVLLRADLHVLGDVLVHHGAPAHLQGSSGAGGEGSTVVAASWKIDRQDLLLRCTAASWPTRAGGGPCVARESEEQACTVSCPSLLHNQTPTWISTGLFSTCRANTSTCNDQGRTAGRLVQTPGRQRAWL